MRIKKFHLKNFKRFTDLTLQDIPENTKLVLLIGSNGSGKSSVFDAFEVLNRYRLGNGTDNTDKYFSKQNKPFEIVLDFGDGYVITNTGPRNNKVMLTWFYGRTSFRQIPRLSRTQLGQAFDINSDSDRPYSFIDRDQRFENDLEHLFGKLLKEFFRSDNDKSEIKKTVIEPINNALNRIFSQGNGTKLELLELIPPLEGKVAELTFKKGNSIFHYNQLSAGEKEIFSILINLIARKENTKGILYFDEVDLHLNTKLQFAFLKELTENWLMPESQLWTASHSLGFIDYARQSESAIIFDFDDYDFDYPKVLSPIPKDNPDVYEIAVGKDILPSLFKDYTLYFVENKDRNYYGELKIDNVLFVQENGKNGVYHKAKNGKFYGLVDRDFLTDSDIEEIEKTYPTLKVLRFYSIENYLYHPDNLDEYYESEKVDFDPQPYVDGIIEEKNKSLDQLKRKFALVRTEYPYFKEPEFNGKPTQNRFKASEENFVQVVELEKYLNSNDFDDFYKIFPMKDYATQLKERQNIRKSDLAKTNWFKEQIASIITKK